MKDQTITTNPVAFAITMSGMAIGIGSFGAIVEFSSQNRTDILGLQFLIIVTVTIIAMCLVRVATHNLSSGNLLINLVALGVTILNIAFIGVQFMSGEPFQYPEVTILTIVIVIIMMIVTAFRITFTNSQFSVSSNLANSPNFFISMVFAGIFVQLLEILLIALSLPL